MAEVLTIPVSKTKKYEKFITSWVSQRDSGQADALNTGFAKVNGNVLGYINSDDRYEHGVFSEIAISSEGKFVQRLERTLRRGWAENMGLRLAVDQQHRI